MKRKRLEAWATWTEKFGWAFALSKPTLRTIETFTTHGRVVRLVECGPDEVVVPKTAAVVVRAAVRWERDIATRNLHDNAPLRFAVMRMQKGRKR